MKEVISNLLKRKQKTELQIFYSFKHNQTLIQQNVIQSDWVKKKIMGKKILII